VKRGSVLSILVTGGYVVSPIVIEDALVGLIIGSVVSSSGGVPDS